MKYDNVTAFNEATKHQVLSDLQACCPIGSWGECIADSRPFLSQDALVTCADDLAKDWEIESVLVAIASHARLGAKPKGADQNSTHSRREQSGLDVLTQANATRLETLQADYLERFGHIFLVRAAGRRPQEILQILEERILRTPDEEAQTAKDELRQIALLRLRSLFD